MLTGQWGRKMRGEIFAVELARQQSVNRQQLKWNRYTAVKKIVRRILAGDQNVCLPVLSKEDWTAFSLFYGITRSLPQLSINGAGRVPPVYHRTRPNCPIHWSIVYRKGRTGSWLSEDAAYAEHRKSEPHITDGPTPPMPVPKTLILQKYGYTSGLFFHINPSITSKVLRG